MAVITITCALPGCNITKTVDLEAMKIRISLRASLSDDWIYLGANDIEGRPDDLFFDTPEHYSEFLNV